MSGLLNNKVRAQSLVDAVAERLEAAIINGTLEPGSRLSEQALAKSLGVSRGPLREAIRRLEGRKLLQRTPNIGVRVAALSLKDLGEAIQVQEALQGMACALAAKNMPDDEIAALKELLHQHSRREGGKQRERAYKVSEDLDFHFRIIMGSRNQKLIEMLREDLFFLLRVHRYKFHPARGRALKGLQDSHRDIVAALARRDPVAAEQKMRQHIQEGWRHMEEQFKAAEGDGGPDAARPKPGTRPKVQRTRRRTRSANPVTGSAAGA